MDESFGSSAGTVMRAVPKQTPAAFLKSWSAVFLGLLLVLAVLFQLQHFFSVKISNRTGNAVWIWKETRLSRGHPVAFFATRNFELPKTRAFVKIKVAADPQYTLYFNGREIGGAAENGEMLDVYDVTELAREGVNRIVIAVRSANGVGGLLATVDVSPNVENLLVTDSTWSIYDAWSEGLLEQNPRGLAAQSPMILGAPPFGRWNFPERREAKEYPESRQLIYPVSSDTYYTALPETKPVSGIVVTISVPATATAYDFGPVTGRVRIELAGTEAREVQLQFANALSELHMHAQPESLVVAKGETSVTDPVSRSFRYVIVYNARPGVSVVVPGPVAGGRE